MELHMCDGDLDLAPTLEALARHGFEGWLVVEAEQDPAKAHPLEHALMARSYLREVLGW
jgi:inosose dehydratase